MADDGTFLEAYRERFRLANDPAMLRAERNVIGGRYGATGYTTIEQAEDLAAALDLAPGKLLLEVGSGAGWPGTYLSESTGCRTILTDPVLEGMMVAATTSRRRSLDAAAVVASGTLLPFRDDTFDASTSSDAF